MIYGMNLRSPLAVIRPLLLILIFLSFSSPLLAQSKASKSQIQAAHRKCKNLGCKSGCAILFTEKSAKAQCINENSSFDPRLGAPGKAKPVTKKPPGGPIPGTQCRTGGEACGNGCCYPPRGNCAIYEGKFVCIPPNNKDCDEGQSLCGYTGQGSQKKAICCNDDKQFCMRSAERTAVPTCVDKCESESEKYCGAKQEGGFVCCATEEICIIPDRANVGHAPSGRNPYCCPAGTTSACRGMCCGANETCAFDANNTSSSSASCCNNDTQFTCGSSCCEKGQGLLCNAEKSECKLDCDSDEYKCGDSCCDKETSTCDITGQRCIKKTPTPSVPPTPPYPPGNAVVCTGKDYRVGGR